MSYSTVFDADVVILSETKLRRPVIKKEDIGNDNYNITQIKSTHSCRGGLVVLVKHDLQVIAEEIIRGEEGDEFVQAVVLKNDKGEAIVGWYNSPCMKRVPFYEKLKHVMTKHNVRCLAGDLNERHPLWCTAHDGKRRGKTLLKLVQELRNVRVHAPVGPTFEAIKCTQTGELRSSTADLVLGRNEVSKLQRVDTYAAVGSDHYPVTFALQWQTTRKSRPRRMSKTMLQSRKLAETAYRCYETVSNEVNKTLDKASTGTRVEAGEAIATMEKALTAPWRRQANKRRRHAPPHWNEKFLKLLARKKLLYERMRWRPNKSNAHKYKEACKATQCYERQLRRERQRRNIQRIQNNPLAEIAVAIRDQVEKRKRQCALDRLNGQQLAPRSYALYMKSKLDVETDEEVELEYFDIDADATASLIEKAIRTMGRNKAAGEDQIHAEMMQANAAAVASMLSHCWKMVGNTKVLPNHWTTGIIVPLFKGKGELGDPKNFRPLCILSHTRKVVEKAVIAQMEKIVETDKAQFGFQSGIQIEQAALRVAALLEMGVNYLLVLDLAKAYDSVSKARLVRKLEELIPRNLLNQLKAFIGTVVAKVTGDISDTVVPMRRGLTQGGTSSPPLFKVFINDLPQQLRETLREKFPEVMVYDPAILVADDVIALAGTLEKMQAIADTCGEWAERNGMCWNPVKSQLLRMIRRMQERGRTNATHMTGAEEEQGVVLNNTVVKYSEEADYLGLRVNIRRGFICKDTTAMLGKGRAAVYTLVSQKWFSLKLKPKFISNLYDTYVRSLLLYGSELLTEEEQQPLIEVEVILIRTFLKGLLKLKSISLLDKHKMRLQLIFHIPTMGMEIGKRCVRRVDAWSKRSASDEPKVAFHARQSMEDIKHLHEQHPLRAALRKVEEGESARSLEAKKWQQLEDRSKGANPISSRHIPQYAAKEGNSQHRFPPFLEDESLDPALKRAMVRWSVYKFPVRHKPSRRELMTLNTIRETEKLSEEEYEDWLEKMRKLFNCEQECWGLWKLSRVRIQDVRHRMRE